MTNGNTDYLQQFDRFETVAGGTAGLLTVPVTFGDAYGTGNNQANGFQFGIGVDSTSAPFTVMTLINGPFFNGLSPVNFQSQGVFIGAGDQDNYVKLVLADQRGIEVLVESEGDTDSDVYGESSANLLGTNQITLFLTIDPSNGTVQPAYVLPQGSLTLLGGAVPLSGALLSAVQGGFSIQGKPSALAVGIISTATVSNKPFNATWDLLRVLPGVPDLGGNIGQ